MNLVFDFGAVLFTWKPAQLLRQTFPAQAASDEAARHLSHQMFSHTDWHAFDRGTLDEQAVIEQTARRLGLPQPAMHDLVHGIGERLTVIEDTLVLLRRLHEQRQRAAQVTGLYFLSNMPLPYARLLEQRYPFLQWFDGGIFSADVQLIKPEPAIYQLLQDRYALDPARTLFIDDLKGNVHAAQAQGWHGVHFESAHQLEAALALRELLP